MYRAFPSQRNSSEEHFWQMSSGAGIDQSHMHEAQNMYAQNMTSFWNPESNVLNKNDIARYAEAGSENDDLSLNWVSKVRNHKSNRLARKEYYFPCVPTPMSRGRKLGFWQDEVSDSVRKQGSWQDEVSDSGRWLGPWWDGLSDTVSNSSSKCISEDSVELSKFLDFNNIDLRTKNHFTPNESGRESRNLSGNTYPCCSNTYAAKDDQQDNCVFEFIKTRCLCDPLLMEKVIKWGTSQTKTKQTFPEDTVKLAQGRLWITVRWERFGNEKEEKSLQDALDNLKGAYQKTEPGVYNQPKAIGCDEMKQHRLTRDSVGLWVIHKYERTVGSWSAVAKELPDGRWVDCKYNILIQVVLIPMNMILEKLRNQACSYQDLAKKVEFLFTTCDRSKLNGKLKSRNLKHNITNLKLKLEKQYALSFAVTVANTAEEMTNDLEAF